jgi:hypothetical protein
MWNLISNTKEWTLITRRLRTRVKWRILGPKRMDYNTWRRIYVFFTKHYYDD